MKNLYITCLCIALLMVSCKMDPSYHGEFMLENKSDYHVQLTGFVLPELGNSKTDTLHLASGQSIESSGGSRTGYIGDPWNVFYADSVIFIYNDTVKEVHVRETPIKNNIRHESSWRVEQISEIHARFTYILTNEDFVRASVN